MFKSKKTKCLFILSIFIACLNQPLHSDIKNYFPYNVGPSASNFGNTGIIELPNARFMEEASLRFNFSSSFPYEYTAITASPFNWFEATYRYAEIKTAKYSAITSYSGNQTLKDKGFDLKFKLLKESYIRPSIAVGLRDIAGTGLFSSEYIVATKNFNNFDFTLGLGFGLLGTAGGVSNPFTLISESFEDRVTYSGEGGAFSYKSWFSGEGSIFGGVEYDLNRYGLRFKLEYDTTNPDTRGAVENVDSRFNIGLTYHLSDSFKLSASLDRGNQFRLGFALKGNFLRDTLPKPRPKNVIKLTEEQKSRVKQNKQIFFVSLNRSLQDESIFIQGANLKDGKADVAIGTERFYSMTRAVGRTARIVSALSLDETEEINIHVMNGDLETAIFSLSKDEFDKADNSIGSKNEILAKAKLSSSNNTPLYRDAEFKPDLPLPDFRWNMHPSVRHQIGGPEGFYLGALVWQTDFTLKIMRQLSFDTSLGINVYDTFDNFTNASYSPIPRVRSDIQRYLDEGKNHIKNMQFTYFSSPFKDIFLRLDLGLFEEMFGGYGGEILYRPFNKRRSYGLSVHRVKQRDYDQMLKFRDYETTTGHFSIYQELPQGLLANMSVGKYLAGDKGITLDLSRRFKTGFILGVFASKTNLSSEEFGEGSFDKGFYVSVPTKLFFTDYTTGHISFGLHPLTKDGAAKLNVRHALFGIVGDSNYQSITRDWDYLLD